jgi:hypothetical protein
VESKWSYLKGTKNYVVVIYNCRPATTYKYNTIDSFLSLYWEILNPSICFTSFAPTYTSKVFLLSIVPFKFCTLTKASTLVA